MGRYTRKQEQRLQIIKFFYQNNCSPLVTFRALLPFYGCNNRPRVLAFARYVAGDRNLSNWDCPIHNGRILRKDLGFHIEMFLLKN